MKFSIYLNRRVFVMDFLSLQLCVLLGWIVCLFICMSCVYGLYSDGDSHLLNLNETVAFQALFRTGWGVAVCWVVFACATGNGGW